MRSILLVEDDRSIADLVGGILETEGFEVRVAPTLASALDSLERVLPDLAVVDIELPDGSGLDVISRVRRSADLPIIILSGRSGEIDQVVGLEIGADDYITKPFRHREFVARVRSALRRTRRTDAALDAPFIYRFDGWTLDVGERTLTASAGQPAPLTRTEFELLHALVRHPRTVLTRDQLVSATSGRPFAGPHDRSIDVRVGRLREKLDDDPDNPRFIRTVRGVGYMFVGGMGDEPGRRN